MSVPLVTFMIATHNRVAELLKTLASCLEQDWPRIEILVVDDASSDGTYEAVRSQCPQVNIVRKAKNQGSIAARNDILGRAQGDYIIALDDDSRFVDPNATRRIVERMEAEPDLGIISFQAIGPEFPERLKESGRLHGEWHCSSFAACAAVIRRKMLDKTGNLVEYLFHVYEEPDLCIRAWDAGYRVLQWNEIVVYHEFSPLNRNEQRNHRYQARNEACSTIMRYPVQLVVPALILRLLRQFQYARGRGWAWQEPRVWFEVLAKLPLALWNRRAVSTKAVKISLALNRQKLITPQSLWRLGDASWRHILTSTIQENVDSRFEPDACAATQSATRI